MLEKYDVSMIGLSHLFVCNGRKLVTASEWKLLGEMIFPLLSSMGFSDNARIVIDGLSASVKFTHMMNQRIANLKVSESDGVKLCCAFLCCMLNPSEKGVHADIRLDSSLFDNVVKCFKTSGARKYGEDGVFFCHNGVLSGFASKKKYIGVRRGIASEGREHRSALFSSSSRGRGGSRSRRDAVRDLKNRLPSSDAASSGLSTYSDTLLGVELSHITFDLGKYCAICVIPSSSMSTPVRLPAPFNVTVFTPPQRNTI